MKVCWHDCVYETQVCHTLGMQVMHSRIPSKVYISYGSRLETEHYDPFTGLLWKQTPREVQSSTTCNMSNVICLVLGMMLIPVKGIRYMYHILIDSGLGCSQHKSTVLWHASFYFYFTILEVNNCVQAYIRFTSTIKYRITSKIYHLVEPSPSSYSPKALKDIPGFTSSFNV